MDMLNLFDHVETEKALEEFGSSGTVEPETSGLLAPAPVIKDYHWNIRIDKKDPSTVTMLKAFLKKTAPNAVRIITAEEIATKTGKHHWHTYIQYKEPRTYYAMRKDAERSFPYNRKGTMSVAKVKKLATNLVYICKDGKPFYLKGVTIDEFTSYKKEWKPKKTQKTLVEKISSEVKDKVCDEDGNVILHANNRSIIVHAVYHHYIGKPMNFARMQDVVHGVIATLKPSYGLDTFCQFLNNKYNENIFLPDYIEQQNIQQWPANENTSDDEDGDVVVEERTLDTTYQIAL